VKRLFWLCLVAVALTAPQFAKAVDCLPRPAGTGTPFHLSQRDGMTALVWWCDRTTHWAPQIVVGTWTPAQIHQAAVELSASPDIAQAARAMLALNTAPLTEALDAFRIEAYWDHARHKPADPVFAVAANSGRTTRPAYPVVNGARGTRQDGTAPVDAPCRFNRHVFIEGRSIYGTFDATNRVAICSKR
jgi:hypothetical protein